MRLTEIKGKIFDVLILIGLAAVTVGLLIFPQEMVSAARDGVELCFNVIIPSLFPFFVISALVVKLGAAEKLGNLLAPVMKPLFNVGGACAPALILGFIGGYPVGARTVISLYESGRCTKSEAERMLAFCNNSGPAFIFGVVGAGIFSSGRIGLLLYLTHMAASVIVGLIFRSWGKTDITPTISASAQKLESFPSAFVESVSGSFQSMLGICGFVIFFTVLIRLLFLSGILSSAANFIGFILSPLGLDSSMVKMLLTGIIELTSGVWSLRDASGMTSSIAMAAFMLGWAGISIHSQVLSFLGSTGISAKTYVLGKFLHGIISAALILLLSRIITIDMPVSAYLAEQVSDFAGLTFVSTFKISAALCAGLLIFFFAISHISPKRGGKSRKKAL